MKWIKLILKDWTHSNEISQPGVTSTKKQKKKGYGVRHTIRERDDKSQL